MRLACLLSGFRLSTEEIWNFWGALTELYMLGNYRVLVAKLRAHQHSRHLIG